VPVQKLQGISPQKPQKALFSYPFLIKRMVNSLVQVLEMEIQIIFERNWLFLDEKKLFGIYRIC
jgi:hypothetical protein